MLGTALTKGCIGSRVACTRAAGSGVSSLFALLVPVLQLRTKNHWALRWNHPLSSVSISHQQRSWWLYRKDSLECLLCVNGPPIRGTRWTAKGRPLYGFCVQRMKSKLPWGNCLTCNRSSWNNNFPGNKFWTNFSLRRSPVSNEQASQGYLVKAVYLTRLSQNQ